MMWREALAAFTSGASLDARRALFHRVAAHHLCGPPGHQHHPDALAVLRRLRWTLLESVSPRERSQLLAEMLHVLSTAEMQAHAEAPHAGTTTKEAAALLVEQLHMLMEANISGVELQPRHYRHPLRSPHLAVMDVELPRLLLQEMQEHTRTPKTPEMEEEVAGAVLDVAAGLASAGHAQAALDLLRHNSATHMCGAVVGRLMKQRHDGWRQAWELVKVVPTRTWVDASSSSSSSQFAWMEAAQRAIRGGVEEDVRSWVGGLLSATATNASPGLRQGVLELYANVCAPTAWATALALVVAHNEQQVKHGTHLISMGRVMLMLRMAGQPMEALKIIYSQPALGQLRTRTPSSSASVLEASGALLHAHDRQHPAIYNHAMMALTEVGWWTDALHLYAHMPTRSNPYTHVSALRMMLRPPSTCTAPPPLNAATFDLCATALRRLAADAATATRRDGFDDDGLGDDVVLWAAWSGKHAEAVELAEMASPTTCRFARLIAMAAAHRRNDGEALRHQLRQLCALRQPCGSMRQVSLAIAIAANTEAVDEMMMGVVVEAACHHVGTAQTLMDGFVAMVVEYAASLEERQRRQEELPAVSEAELRERLTPAHKKRSVMDLFTCSPCGAGSWRIIANIFTKVAQQQHLSMARAAPIMVAAGVDPSVAIEFLH